MNTSGQIIFDARHQRNLTQQQVADGVKCSASAVGKWEQGVLPDPEYRAKLERLLDLETGTIYRAWRDDRAGDANSMPDGAAPQVSNL